MAKVSLVRWIRRKRIIKTLSLWFRFERQRQGTVLATQAIDHRSSELKVVQKLLEALALQDVVVTMDALHCRATFAGESSPAKLA